MEVPQSLDGLFQENPSIKNAGISSINTWGWWLTNILGKIWEYQNEYQHYQWLAMFRHFGSVGMDPNGLNCVYCKSVSDTKPEFLEGVEYEQGMGFNGQ